MNTCSVFIRLFAKSPKGRLSLKEKGLTVSFSNLMSHYTSLEGFKAIIQSGKLWATNVAFLNDAKEYFHAYEIFNSQFKKFEKEVKPISSDDRYFFSALRQCMDDMDSIGSEHHYVIAFSENHDQLSQWRAYGSIGILFNKKIFEAGLSEMATVSTCKYETKSLEEILHIRIGDIYADYQKALKVGDREAIYSLAVDLQIYLYDIAPFYKDRGFHEECEIRLSIAATDDHEIKFRVADSYLIPYIELRYDPRAIDSIIIGPCVDPGRTERSVRLFMERQFPKSVHNIYRSKTPFRNW